METLWGKQTDLAIGNFPIAHRPLDVRLARALAMIKRHAAVVNAVARRPRARRATSPAAIGDAARRVEAGELDDQFPIDVYQTGSGTSTNMNVNEVLASVAGRSLGRDVHPNDHVNASQSSNDTVPTAIRIAVAQQLVDDVHPAVQALSMPCDDMAERFAHVVKAGRTHLMDATPVTLGQEAGGLGRPARRRPAPVGRRRRRRSASCRSAGPPSAPGSTPRRASRRR